MEEFKVKYPNAGEHVIKELMEMPESEKFMFLSQIFAFVKECTCPNIEWIIFCLKKVPRIERTESFIRQALALAKERPNDELGKIIWALGQISQDKRTETLIQKIRTLLAPYPCVSTGRIIRYITIQEDENIEAFIDQIQSLVRNHPNINIEKVIDEWVECPHVERMGLVKQIRALLAHLKQNESKIEGVIGELRKISLDKRQDTIKDTLEKLEGRYDLTTDELIKIFLKQGSWWW